MKKLLFSVFLLLTTFAAIAQYPKYVIQFKDKQNNSFSINTPSAFLSTKAIQRKTKYNISLDSTDLPLSTSYINTVKAQGAVTVLSQSKWLNRILIYCIDQNAINQIQALPFVSNVQAIGQRVVGNNNLPVKDKFKEDLIDGNSNDRRPFAQQRTTADYYDYGNTYNQVHIHEGEYLHNLGYKGQGITIAILDAGFYQYLNHVAFDSLRNENRILGVKDFVDFDNSVNEDNNHGMNCLSTIASNKPGTMVGTAPKASFYLLRTENANSEYPIEEFNWVVGAEYADSCGVDMISSSLGYNQFDDPSFNHTYDDLYKNRTTVTQGAALAVKKGMIVTNSAGNEGNGGWKYLIFPSDADSVCTVGAIDINKNVASFSSYGYPGKTKPNITSVGAGTAVAGSDNSFAYGNGTSFSNPNINGLIACLWQAFPEFNNMQILDAVYRSCPTYATPDDRIGFGIPNMRIAYGLLQDKRNSLVADNWLQANPVPFNTTLKVTLKAPETGKANIQLLDVSGKLIDAVSLDIVKDNIYDVKLSNVHVAPRGVYFITYRGSVKKTISVIKQ